MHLRTLSIPLVNFEHDIPGLSRCRGTFITTLVSSCDAYTTFTVTCTVVQFLYNGGDNASGW